MPSELLHIPPLYTLVGLYRLFTDPFIRQPVFDKVKHATIRGVIVAALYAAGSWKVMRWVVKTFIIGGPGIWFGFGAAKRRVEGSVGADAGRVWVGIGGVGGEVDLVLYTHLLILIPQISQILRFFIYKNLRIARSRAYALTVSSRGKPSGWWSQGYIEEWQQPPQPSYGDKIGSGAHREKQAKWVGWLLWWPTQMVMRHYLLIPLSPSLPLIVPIFTSFLRAITTAEFLHQPYFEVKGMQPAEVWRWVEERKWAYRAVFAHGADLRTKQRGANPGVKDIIRRISFCAPCLGYNTFGFAASFLESMPIIGLFFSISNRVGAAMWAFDLEKRQHLFHHAILKPLPRNMVGIWGTGSIHDVGVDIQAAEKKIEQYWADQSVRDDGIGGGTGSGEIGDGEGEVLELKGRGMGSEEKGREKLL